jgi:cytolysin-activating lysine-acyltransferase
MPDKSQGAANPAQSAKPASDQGAAQAALAGTAPTETAFGQAVWLMMNMPQFRHVFLCDLEWMVLPPIMLNQYRLLKVGNRVVAFAAWGYLSEAAEVRLQEASPRLAPVDWKSGDRLWLISVFAPFGHQEAIIADVRDGALAGRTFKLHRRTPDGKPSVEVVTGAPLGRA